VSPSTVQEEAAAEQEVIDAWTLFQIALSPRKAYPMKELTTLFDTVVRYAAVMQDSPYLHKTISGTFFEGDEPPGP